MAIKNDLTGQRFGRLIVVGESEKINGRRIWKCECDCGEKVEVRQDCLKSGSTKSCGCYAKESSSKNGKKNGKKSIVDITNKRFGRLVAIEQTEERAGGCVKWLCRCDCGNIAVVSSSSLNRANTRSCGCLERELTKVRAKETIKKAHRHNVENDNKEKTRLSMLDVKVSKKNTSGIKGVCWHKRANKYMASIKFQGVNHYLGIFTNKQDAINARKEAEEKYFKPMLEKYGKEQKP